MSVEPPLAGLVRRALGVDAADVRSEPLGVADGVERERVRYATGGAERTVVLERLAARHDLEVQLLPFLARKTDRVPVVHARGIPPTAVPAPKWLLVEDLVDAPSACDADPRAVLDAKLAVEEAVAQDGPALRALGVPVRSPAHIAEEIALAAGAGPDADEAREAARRLSDWPVALAHGGLACRSVLLTPRGVVIRGWGRAHLGCALLDVVRLVRDLVERDQAVLGIGLTRTYAERLGLVLPTELLRGAEKLEGLARHYLGP